MSTSRQDTHALSEDLERLPASMRNRLQASKAKIHKSEAKHTASDTKSDNHKAKSTAIGPRIARNEAITNDFATKLDQDSAELTAFLAQIDSARSHPPSFTQKGQKPVVPTIEEIAAPVTQRLNSRPSEETRLSLPLCFLLLGLSACLGHAKRELSALDAKAS